MAYDPPFKKKPAPSPFDQYVMKPIPGFENITPTDSYIPTYMRGEHPVIMPPKQNFASLIGHDVLNADAALLKAGVAAHTPQGAAALGKDFLWNMPLEQARKMSEAIHGAQSTKTDVAREAALSALTVGFPEFREGKLVKGAMAKMSAEQTLANLGEEGFLKYHATWRALADNPRLPASTRAMVEGKLAELNPVAEKLTGAVPAPKGPSWGELTRTAPAPRVSTPGIQLQREAATGMEIPAGAPAAPGPLSEEQIQYNISRKRLNRAVGQTKPMANPMTPELPKPDKQWAVLTAENPGGMPASPEENARYMADLTHYLDAKKIPYQLTKGGYRDEATGQVLREGGVYLPNITPEQADYIGKLYRQNSIVTNEGLRDFTNNTLIPSKGIVPASEASPAFTTLPDGSTFMHELDWNAGRPLTQPKPAVTPRPQYDRAALQQKELDRLSTHGFQSHPAKWTPEQIQQHLPAPGTPVAQWSPANLEAYGQSQGVKNLGYVSPEHTVHTKDGRALNIPGGEGGKWSYYDLLTMKAQGFNPADLDPADHNWIMRKMGRTMQPGVHDDAANTFRGYLLAFTSPANPLTPNEFAVAKIMPRNMDDIKKLGAMAEGSQNLNTKQRLALNHKIAQAYGVQSAEKGGLGVRGNADYVSLAEFAKMYADHPEWFRKGANEPWDVLIGRVSSQVKGLAPKTAGFGGVWQDVANADISAIDRHMGDVFWKDLANSPEDLARIEQQLIDDWNAGSKKGKPNPQVKTLDELRVQSGGEMAFKDRVMNMIMNHRSAKMRDAKTGEFGKNVPEWAKSVNWIKEPESVTMMGPDWERAMKANRKLARGQDLSTFLAQWGAWDPIRGRFEPHEVMFPGLNKLTRMTDADIRGSLAAHKEAKYFSNKKKGKPSPIKAVSNPMDLAYWSLVGGLGVGGAAARKGKD